MVIQDRNKVSLGIFGKYDILATNFFRLSVVVGLFDGFNLYGFVFLLLMTSIFLIVSDADKNIFLAILAIGSYLISYFLYTISVLNAFVYGNHIYIVNTFISIIAICFGILHYGNEKKDRIKYVADNIRIDVPLPLIFLTVFLAFIASTMNCLSVNSMSSRFLSAISNANPTVVLYYCHVVIYVIFFIIPFSALIFLSLMAINKYIAVKYDSYAAKMGDILLILSGLLILFYR